MKTLKLFIQKSLSVFRLGKEWLQRLLGSLADAARSISYVETVNPSQSDTLHREIKHSDECSIEQAFEYCTREVVKKLGLCKVMVAIDVTEDLFWGESSYHTRASVHEIGLESWQFVNLAIVQPYFIPLKSLPYRQTENLDDIVMKLLDYLETLQLEIELVLFDRGFYHWHLMDYLNNRFPYLIFAPKNKAIKCFITQTDGCLGDFQHSGKYSKDKSTWKAKTKIVIIKDEKYNWCFATNQLASIQLVQIYRKRWNIETGFRIHDEARIKTKSVHPLIRYFYHLLGMLFILIWRIKQKYQPKLVFKRFLKSIELMIINESTAPT